MRKQVQIGQHYRDRAAFWSEWRVERIFNDRLGVPHAVVSSNLDQTEHRTIGCMTLLDPRRYQAVTGATPPRPIVPVEDIVAAVGART